MTSAVDRELLSLLEEGIRAGAFPTASVWIAADLEPAGAAAAGGAHPETRFDLASLTKPIAVATLAMKAVAEGRLDLDERIPRLDVPVRDLLAHRGGLPALDDLASWLDRARPGWKPGTPETRDAVLERIASLRKPSSPPAAVYSDLGYIALGAFLEDRLGSTLDRLVPGYLPAGPPESFPPTGSCPYRRRRLAGEVNDLNAWVLGGVAGHAGLFGTAAEVGRWAVSLASAYRDDRGPVPRDVVRAFWDLGNRLPGDTWVLGFDTPTPGASTAGSRFPPDAVGHLGFTGTSVWIDPRRGVVAVLLTNRAELGAGSVPRLRAFRPVFHDRVMGLLGH